jgi:hypothetical protein
MKRRTPKSAFKPGVSGNPGGRPKAVKAVEEAARVAAATALLDRAWGRPMQRQDVTSQGERIGYVIAAPDEDESPEVWQARQNTKPH